MTTSETTDELAGIAITPLGYVHLIEDSTQVDVDDAKELLMLFASFLLKHVSADHSPAMVYDGTRWLFAQVPRSDVLNLTVANRALRKVNVREVTAGALSS